MNISKTEKALQESTNMFSQTYIDLISKQENISKNYESALSAANKISSFLEEFGTAMVKVDEITNTVQSTLKNMAQMSAFIEKILLDFKLPSFTKEEQDKIIKSHQQWGAFGWTWLSAAPFNFYNIPPLNIHDANTKAEKYCSTEEMEKTFQELRTYKIQQDDLESAIWVFQNRQYKACALLLFTLIDAILIQNQKANKREVGKKAVNALKAQTEGSDEIKIFFMLLRYSNLFACLEVLFANGKNFENEPVVINRNFICHGMSNRHVDKLDCIQLFFVLKNLSQLMENEC